MTTSILLSKVVEKRKMKTLPQLFAFICSSLESFVLSVTLCVWVVSDWKVLLTHNFCSVFVLIMIYAITSFTILAKIIARRQTVYSLNSERYITELTSHWELI